MSMLESPLAARIPLQEDFQLVNGNNSPTPKRKLADDTSEDLGDYIAISDASHGTIKKLKPKQTVSRGTLSLAHINFDRSSETSRSLLFSAYIWSLERGERTQNQEPVVLVVQDEDNSLGVVEKIAKGVYTLLWLAKWVTLQDLERRPAKQHRFELQNQTEIPTNAGHWWQSAAVRMPCAARPSSSLLADPTITNKLQEQNKCIEDPSKEIEDLAAPTAEHSIIEDTSTNAQAEPVDWTLKVREHYLEALYASRAPIAYFVKGPLSRARIAYQALDQDRKLAELLRASILPVKVRSNVAIIDKKYSKGVPDVINEVPSGITSEESGEIVGLLQDRLSKSRRRKKVTPEGLLPGEEEHIIKWWIKREIGISHEGVESIREQRIKRAITEQKFRETQLQIVVILEAMALEAQNDHPAQDSIPDTNDSQKQPVSKEKKPLELGRALDILVEKLQIWETMNEDSITLPAGSRETFSENSNSCLRAFCLDIILPFYVTRLPDVSKDFCRKFGVVLSPEKKVVRTTSSSKVKNKPGEPVKERPSRKPLDRVLTSEGLLSKRKPASLKRSATDSLVPFIKEELQEVSLAKIPTARQPIHQSKFYARREVDLTAEVKATEAKMKRKAEIEQQLKGAIFALKKPNARLAVKEYVDTSDQRNRSKKGRPRKSQNPVRNPFAAGVQVTATPRTNRHKPHLVTGYQMPGVAEEAEPEISPPSSVPVIPSSTRKSVAWGLTMASESAISSTPTKAVKTFSRSEGLDKKRVPMYDQTLSLEYNRPSTGQDAFENLDSEPELPSIKGVTRPSQLLPLGQRSRIVAATPVKRVSLTYIGRSTSDDNIATVFTTPRRSTPPSSTANVMVSSPLKMQRSAGEVIPNQENDQSKEKGTIYDALGWDDDFDI